MSTLTKNYQTVNITTGVLVALGLSILAITLVLYNTFTSTSDLLNTYNDLEDKKTAYTTIKFRVDNYLLKDRSTWTEEDTIKYNQDRQLLLGVVTDFNSNCMEFNTTYYNMPEKDREGLLPCQVIDF